MRQDIGACQCCRRRSGKGRTVRISTSNPHLFVMPRSTSSVMGFPPFRGAVRQIILASGAIYVVILLLEAFATPYGSLVLAIGSLSSSLVRGGWIWQLMTYPFMSQYPWAFVVSLSGIYFLG